MLGRALRAESQAELDDMWDEFTALTQGGLETPIVDVGGGQGVFAVSGQQLALRDQNRELTASFGDSSAALEGSIATLPEGAGRHNT